MEKKGWYSNKDLSVKKVTRNDLEKMLTKDKVLFSRRRNFD